MRNKLLLFGDDLTEYSSSQEYGFALAPALQTTYSRKLDVITRGYAGYTSDEGFIILQQILHENKLSTTGKIVLMYISFGLNDATVEARLSVPLERYVENLHEMITLCKAHGIRVVLVGPPPYDELNRPRFLLPGESDEGRSLVNNLAYSSAASLVAKQTQVPFCDLFHSILTSARTSQGSTSHRHSHHSTSRSSVAESPRSSHRRNLEQSVDVGDYFFDGLHLNGNGYQVFYDQLMHIIVTHYIDLAPVNIANDLPSASEIDPKDRLLSLKNKSTF